MLRLGIILWAIILFAIVYAIFPEFFIILLIFGIAAFLYYLYKDMHRKS